MLRFRLVPHCLELYPCNTIVSSHLIPNARGVPFPFTSPTQVSLDHPSDESRPFGIHLRSCSVPCAQNQNSTGGSGEEWIAGPPSMTKLSAIVLSEARRFWASADFEYRAQVKRVSRIADSNPSGLRPQPLENLFWLDAIYKVATSSVGPPACGLSPWRTLTITAVARSPTG